MRKPRAKGRPQAPTEAQLRLAYLEGLSAYLEGDLLAPPDIGRPLAKEWLRGWHRGEEVRADIRDELSEDEDFYEELCEQWANGS